MKRRLLALAVSALVCQQAWAAEPAELSLYLFDEGRPVADAEVQIDAAPRGRTSSDGALNLRIEPGARRLRVLRAGNEVLNIELNLVEDEDAQIIATLYADSAPSVFIESTNAGAAAAADAKPELGPPGTLSGRVVNAEDGKPVAGARIYVSGTPIDLVSDAEGRYSAEIAPGSYAISVLAPRFASRSFEGIAIASEQTTEQPIELTPAGVELPEFVVLEPFIEGSLASFVEERRTSSAVTDILGAEQISRAGDSDAAGALKRVTGLTLVGGKFVYVRGLGERYSSVLLNGAQIPSPDPTRKVVPLDLFPTDILQGVVVQKTYSADMPGEFGGGTIQLRTRGYPEGPLLRVSGGLGGAQGTSFEEGLGYEGGGRDWTGKDDGSRDLPQALDELRRAGLVMRQRSPANPNGFTSEQFQEVGREVSGPYNVDPEKIGPNGNLAVSGGNQWNFTDDLVGGFLASTRWSRAYDTREEVRRFYVASNAGPLERDIANIRRTDTEINGSAFFAAGLSFREQHNVRLTSLLLRQTEDLALISDAVQDNQPLQRYELEWVENSLLSHQLAGEHSLPWFTGRAKVDWQYTDARARRYAPRKREYRFNFDGEGNRRLSLLGESNVNSWADLIDDASNWSLSAALPFKAGSWVDGSLTVLANSLQRDRDSYLRRYEFESRFTSNALRDELLRLPTLEDILSPANIAPTRFQLRETTQGTDTYIASQKLTGQGLMIDTQLGERLRVNLGLREEDNLQEVTTFSVVNPGLRDIGLVDRVDRLPSGALTYSLTERQQLRAAYAETVARPDFRELTESSFVDPITDFQTFGNPNLVAGLIEHFDVRWEYYFSNSESLSVALFRKDFTNPIEKTFRTGSGSILQTLENAQAATNQGIEIDVFKQLDFVGGWLQDKRWANWARLDRLDWANWYVSANYARIESEITLDPVRNSFNTNSQRPLEGQSPYVVNFQLGYQSADGRREAALLFNQSGERIVLVGVDTLPDAYEQPAPQLDFSVKQSIGEDWSLRLRLRNLLDPRIEITQGPGIPREYKRGREVSLSVEWRPF